MTSLPTIDHDDEVQADLEDEHAEPGEEHADHRMFGLATFLVADGMTFAGF
ncbi:MAG: heme-copper oxidase subunit III, partial [Cyanobacteriota bacterium]|nr:heme-copper oxidase subunit III [Cyanobacteriota bacterium]